MRWVEMHLHQMLLPATSLLLFANGIYMGVRRRAGRSPEDIPGAVKALYLFAFVIIFVLAIFYRYR